MKRRQLLVGGGAVATAVLAGCIGNAQTATSDGESRTLTVSKSGEATAAPDEAVVHVSIEATGDSPAAVRNELSERSTTLNGGLIAAGIPEDDITTGRFSIYERREPVRLPEGGGESGGERQETTRYEGTHVFRIEVDDVESVGSVVDTAVESGADTVRRIEFTLSEAQRADLREEALQSAIETARSEAAYVAGEVDQSVVGVESVDTSGGGFSPVSREYATAEAADAGSTELQPGDVTIQATVRVTYEIG